MNTSNVRSSFYLYLRSRACWFCKVFLNQLMSGSGVPVAIHVSFTVSPSLTIVSTLDVRLSISAGTKIRNQHCHVIT